jgi:hypothetical protein
LYDGDGVGILKIEESESEVLCTDSTALLSTVSVTDKENGRTETTK